MNIEQYNKAAAIISARIIKENLVIVVVSSSENVESVEVAYGIASAFMSGGKNVLLVEALLGEASGATFANATDIDGLNTLKLVPSGSKKDIISDTISKGMIGELRTGYDVVVVACDCILNSVPAMHFCAAGDGVVFVEKKKISRTDSITKALEMVENLEAIPLGFVYVD